MKQIKIITIGIFAILLTVGLSGCNERYDDLVVFYPCDNGDLIELGHTWSWLTNWECVDEVDNDWDDYVWSVETVEQTDLYQVDDHTTESGPISYIIIFYRGNSQFADGEWAQVKLKIGENTYNGTKHNLLTNWTWFNYRWDVNPDDGDAWEWTDIDNLQIGITLKGTRDDSVTRITSIKLAVYYSCK